MGALEVSRRSCLFVRLVSVLRRQLHERRDPIRRNGVHRSCTVAHRANGLLLPFIALQTYMWPFIGVASCGQSPFPVSPWTLALMFRRDIGPADARESPAYSD